MTTMEIDPVPIVTVCVPEAGPASPLSSKVFFDCVEVDA